MKKITIFCLVFMIFLLSNVSAAFEIEITENETNDNNNIEDTADLTVQPHLGTFVVEMTYPENEQQEQNYPYNFKINAEGLTEPTVDITVNSKFSLFPVIEPQFDLVFIENRPEHPAYNLVVVFFASGNDNVEIYVIITIEVDENQVGEERGTIGISNSGFHPYPWRDMTFYPRFEIYKERYDPPFYNNYLHTTTTKLNIDVTIKNEKSIQLIENFPFLYRLINLLIN